MVTSCAHNETWITLFSQNIPFFMRDLTEKKLVFKPWYGCIGTITVFFTETEAHKKRNVNFEVPSFISIEDLF